MCVCVHALETGISILLIKSVSTRRSIVDHQLGRNDIHTSFPVYQYLNTRVFTKVNKCQLCGKLFSPQNVTVIFLQ